MGQDISTWVSFWDRSRIRFPGGAGERRIILERNVPSASWPATAELSLVAVYPVLSPLSASPKWSQVLFTGRATSPLREQFVFYGPPGDFCLLPGAFSDNRIKCYKMEGLRGRTTYPINLSNSVLGTIASN